MNFSATDLIFLAPELVLSIGASLLLLLPVMGARRNEKAAPEPTQKDRSTNGSGVPGEYPARSSTGHPILISACFSRPRSPVGTDTLPASRRGPTSGATFLDRSTSSRTAGSDDDSTRVSPSLDNRSRPYRATWSTISTRIDAGTA